MLPNYDKASRTLKPQGSGFGLRCSNGTPNGTHNNHNNDSSNSNKTKRELRDARAQAY